MHHSLRDAQLRERYPAVGVLPGKEKGGKKGFICLNDSVADFDRDYVFDRSQAATYHATKGAISVDGKGL